MSQLDSPESVNKVDEPQQWYEYGYRLEDGTEEWQSDYGTDGSWTAYDSERGIEAIDIYLGNEAKAIYAGLDAARVTGVAIRKLVTRTEGSAEVVDRP